MTPALPRIHADRLGNGLDLRAVEMPALPIVSIALLFRAGSANDPAGQAGLSYLTGTSLDAGTITSDIHALAERIEFLGTAFHVSVMHDASAIVCTTLTHHLDDVMCIIGEILTGATFPQQEVDRLRLTQITSLIQMRDRPGARASYALDRVLFGLEHPYGVPTMGTRTTVEQLSQPDTVTFFRERYRPEGAVAIATGDVTIDGWREMCERHLGHWQSGAVSSRSPVQARTRDRRNIFLVDRPATPQAEVRMGSIAMPRNHQDYLAASVLNHCLGGQFTSRLNASLREQRGLTYGAWSAFSALRSSGSFVQGGAFHTARTDEAISVLIDEVHRIAGAGITPEELRYAQRSLSGNFLRSFETPSHVAARLQAVYAFDLPEDHYRTYLERLNTLTGQEILQVSQRWLDPGKFAVVVVGDSGSLKQPIEKLGLAEVVDYDDA
jgi:zinc protease